MEVDAELGAGILLSYIVFLNTVPTTYQSLGKIQHLQLPNIDNNDRKLKQSKESGNCSHELLCKELLFSER